MVDRDCPICHGLGWVCENHPRKAWSVHGCQCGCGKPCRCQDEEVLVVEFILEETVH